MLHERIFAALLTVTNCVMRITKQVLQALGGSQKGNLAAAAFLCSVPPSGNGPMAQRFLREQPVASFKVSFAQLQRYCLHA